MTDLFDETANYVLDLASPQRMQILFKLLEKNYTPTALAKEIEATKQEVHRNFMRLEESGLIEKKTDDPEEVEELLQSLDAPTADLSSITEP